MPRAGRPSARCRWEKSVCENMTAALDGEAGEGAASGVERRVDDGVVVGDRDKSRFIRRWREVDAGIEHRVEKRVEALRVALRDFSEAHRDALGEIEAEHAADSDRREGNRGFLCDRRQALARAP